MNHAGGTMSLAWTDEAIVPVDVERRAALSTGNWSTVSSNSMAGSFADSATPAGRAFYRVRVR